MTSSIAIVGAGIGGLSTALVLKQKGLPVTVYESTAEIKPVGAGIVMASNAMQIFQKLGVREKIENAGYRVSRMKITDEQLKNISTVDLAKFEQKYGVHNVAIHRADLQRILAEEIGFQHICLGKRLSKIERQGAFRLTFENGAVVLSDVVIGADGIHSTVRTQLFKSGTLRDSGQQCWRGVCEIDLPQKYRYEAYEAWGKGKRLGFVRINEQAVYWYAVVNTGMIRSQEMDLRVLFREFHPDILAIISATPEEQVHFSDLMDLKPIFQWQQDNVCLIGDAAHATTPNMGQGACQAVEDAYVIGRLLETGKPISAVFAEYEKIRIRKAHHIVHTSWTIGKAAHLENGLGIWFRNLLMRSLPQSVNNKQLEEIFDINYV